MVLLTHLRLLVCFDSSGRFVAQSCPDIVSKRLYRAYDDSTTNKVNVQKSNAYVNVSMLVLYSFAK